MVAPALEDLVFYTGAYFCIYWILFAVLYVLPFPPRRSPAPATDGGQQSFTNPQLAFANRTCAVTHAIINVTACAIVCLEKYASTVVASTVASSRLFFPLDYLQESDPAYHWVLPILLAYCLADSVFMLIWEPIPIYLWHHAGVLFAVLPLYLCEHGWMLVVVSTILAEITNPVQNSYFYAEVYSHSICAKVLRYPYLLTFTFFRGILMPITLFDFFLFIFIESHLDPNVQTSLLWMKFAWFIFFVGLCGSLLFLKSTLVEHFSRKEHLKVQ